MIERKKRAERKRNEIRDGGRMRGEKRINTLDKAKYKQIKAPGGC